jgi:hypothetical protein
MNRKSVLPLLAFSLTAIVVTSAAVNVAAPTNRCVLPKGLFPKLPPGFKDPREELLCNQKKRSITPRSVTKKAPRLSPAPVWIRQLNHEFTTDSWAVAVGPQENIYIAGTTFSSSSIRLDAFFTKYSSQGKLLWTEEFAPIPVIPNTDYATGIAADSRGNAFITGTTYYDSEFSTVSTPYIVKYSPKKKLL